MTEINESASITIIDRILNYMQGNPAMAEILLRGLVVALQICAISVGFGAGAGVTYFILR